MIKINKFINFLALTLLITSIGCPNPTDINNQYPVNYIRLKKDDNSEINITKSTQLSNLNINSTLETPVIATNKSGNSILAWVDNAKGTRDVFAQRIDNNGNPIGKILEVNTNTREDQHLPAVAINENGSFIIAWSTKGQDGDGYGVYARRYDKNGIYSGNEFKVNTSTTGDQWIPSVAMTNNGGFVVVWESTKDRGSYNIVGQKFDKTGNSFGTEFFINSSSKGSQEFPKISMDSVGNFIVVWTSNQNRDFLNPDTLKFKDIYGRKFNKDGVPNGAEFVVSTTIGEQNLPAVSLSDNNSYIVAWNLLEQNTNNYDIYARTFINGIAQKASFRVDSNSRADMISKPALAIDNTGNFIIVWNSVVGLIGSSGLYGKKYDSNGNEKSTEYKINSSNNNVLQPDINGNKSGIFLTTWREY